MNANTGDHGAMVGGRRRARRGFTMIELMVAIAAVAVLSLGLAQIFTVAGRTVSAGKRVSALTQYAAALERQLRDDIRAITRDGFFVIRNELTNDGSGPVNVRSAAAGGAARPRRVDEMVFFRLGQFQSARLAYVPGRTATASSARVYWGHGLQQGVESNLVASLGDNNALGAYFGRPGPNQYAGDWILARHETLLAQPAGARADTPDGLLALGPNPPRWSADSDVQVGMQPSSRDIFRDVYATFGGAAVGPGDTVPTLAASQRDSGDPTASSGLVDVATTDLASIRRAVLELKPPSGAMGSYSGQPGEYSVASGKADDMQAWMMLSLPAESDRGRRLRVEAAPPNLLGLGWTSGGSDAATRADQLALSAHAFMPQCTEFIVEWSFGDTLPNGRINWHGLRRGVDLNSDGVITTGAGEYEIQPYDGLALRDPIRARDGSSLPLSVIPYDSIHGAYSSSLVLYSFFGYADPDPSYNPRAGGLFVDVNRNGVYDPEDGDILNYPDTIPWAWPKLLRVTVSLADPSDPTIEQTFQFIFNVPQGSPGGSQ